MALVTFPTTSPKFDSAMTLAKAPAKSHGIDFK